MTDQDLQAQQQLQKERYPHTSFRISYSSCKEMLTDVQLRGIIFRFGEHSTNLLFGWTTNQTTGKIDLPYSWDS